VRGLPTTRTGEIAFAAILFDMIHGRAPTSQALQQLPGLGDAAASALSELVEIGAVVVGDDGEVVAAYPLSAIPTRHRVEVGELHPWANCAFDALAVPGMLGRRGTISPSVDTAGGVSE
jgi:hypothetical protein